MGSRFTFLLPLQKPELKAAPAHDTAVARWAITAKGKPRLQRRCVPLGLTLPRAC